MELKINSKYPMLNDIQYVRGNKSTDYEDYLYVIWRDIESGEKHLEIISEPEVPIYIEKEEFRNEHFNKHTNQYYNITFKELDKCEKKIVKYKDILAEIAKEAGPKAMDNYTKLAKTDWKRLREFQLWPFVFGSDIDIRGIYRNLWKDLYDHDKAKILHKGFLDIEVDIMETGMTDPKVCPVDLVTLIDAYDNVCYTFALTGVDNSRDLDMNMTDAKKKEILDNRKLYASRLKQQEELESDPAAVIEKIHETFDENYPGMDFRLYFYKDEKTMLNNVFQTINKLKLDMIGIWNMRFDIPYLIERFKVLGLDPAEQMCHPDFPVKICYFSEDTRNFTAKNQSDFFNLSSYTLFVCQMRNYAAIRKGRTELRNNKLTYIAQREIGDEKLDYSDTGGSIRSLSCRDYLTYILYNIKDVLLQVGIEKATNDMDSLYVGSYDSNCPYQYVYKQTMKTQFLRYRSYLEQGLIVGNNINQFFQKGTVDMSDDDSENNDDVGFEGALVGNPVLNSEFGVPLYGKRSSSIFRYCIDMDMSSFYPSIINLNNIEPLALIYKCIMRPEVYNVRGGNLKYNGITSYQMVKDNNDTFDGDVAAECFDNLQTRNYISTGEKWLNLPGVEDIYKACLKEDSESTDKPVITRRKN